MKKNRDRPAKRVKFSSSDTKIIKPGGGGGGKFFKEVSIEFKNQLTREIEDSMISLDQSDSDTGIMVVEIESQALAKSHRPDAVFDEECPFIGDIGINNITKQGKFLVRITNKGLYNIRHRIATSTAEYYEKALSTISKLKIFEVDFDAQKFSDNSAVIRLVDFKDEQYNDGKLKKYNSLVSQKNIKSKEIIEGCGVFHIESFDNDNMIMFINSLKKNNILLSVKAAQRVNFKPFHLGKTEMQLELPPADDDKSYPVVGVVDTSIKENCPNISSWYEGEVTSIIEEDRVYGHGTFVAGLISNSFNLNSYDENFPKSQSKVFSVGVLGKDGGTEHEIFDMLKRAQRNRPDIKVWNLSLGTSLPVELTQISDFAVMLDQFQKENDCICIIAAGNIEETADLRRWPPQAHEPINEQRISSPGDSVLGITVASIAQINGIVNKFEPSIFSRSGPVANYVLKPDVSHYGGNHLENGKMLSSLGITSLGISNGTQCSYSQDCGTSFATPLVSTITANLWEHMGVDTPRSTIKGLLSHSARLRQEVPKNEKIYYGWGMPFDVNNYMYCNENEITIILEGEIGSNTEVVGKLPFPMPDSLRTEDNKIKAEFFMTVSYDPPLDSNRAFEYCLVNIDAGLGKVNPNGSFNGMVPAEGTGYEQDLVNGKYKWSPIKIYHKKYPNGVDAENWKLQVKMLTRHGFNPDDDFVQPFSIILTIRALEDDAQVYNEMVTLMNQYNWEVSNANIEIEPKIQL